MGIKDIATVQAYHRDRIHQFGAGSSEALGWKNRQSQFSRFAELCRLADFSACSVLDLGCGHGDLFAYLDERYAGVTYTGIDQTDAFLELAVQRYGSRANCTFYRAEFGSVALPEADYVLCSGALNYRHSEPGYLQRMIVKFFSAARQGMAINLLRRVDFPDGVLVAYDPDEVLDFCRKIAPHAVMHDCGAAADNYTVLLYRNRDAARH